MIDRRLLQNGYGLSFLAHGFQVFGIGKCRIEILRLLGIFFAPVLGRLLQITSLAGSGCGCCVCDLSGWRLRRAGQDVRGHVADAGTGAERQAHHSGQRCLDVHEARRVAALLTALEHTALPPNPGARESRARLDEFLGQPSINL